MLGLMATAPWAQDTKQDPNKKPEKPKKPIQAKPNGVIWVGSWEEAVKEATARNVPIHYTAHMDN
jgi:hypothetical protein